MHVGGREGTREDVKAKRPRRTSPPTNAPVKRVPSRPPTPQPQSDKHNPVTPGTAQPASGEAKFANRFRYTGASGSPWARFRTRGFFLPSDVRGPIGLTPSQDIRHGDPPHNVYPYPNTHVPFRAITNIINVRPFLEPAQTPTTARRRHRGLQEHRTVCWCPTQRNRIDDPDSYGPAASLHNPPHCKNGGYRRRPPLAPFTRSLMPECPSRHKGKRKRAVIGCASRRWVLAE